jgi:phenylpropionate dioxygenase-like ring-hydroxylating dioxygenase large terminal subunit
MSYLQNAWYAAGWSSLLDDVPLARTIHDQPLVIYRGEAGKPIALADMCPHRFAPLSRGKVKGDRIVCGYHGLEFDNSGKCVRNPHGKGMIPAALTVRAYRVAERYGMIWIWMGDTEQADVALIPALPGLEDSNLSWIHGQLHVAADYQLVTDNLLDLSHVEFMHPFLAAEGNSERTAFRAEQKGDQVSAYYDMESEPISGLFRLLWEGDDEVGSQRAYMHWQAPSNLYLDVAMAPIGGNGANEAQIPSVHLLTPETADTTHYFWAAGRNRCHNDEQISGMLHFGTQNAFENEDEPMIRAVRSRMTSNDLFAHKPAILPFDEAGVRARRVLKKLIDAEQVARDVD